MPAVNQTNIQISRLNFRLPVELKERIEKAAIISGVTVTDFAISKLADSADEVLEKHQTRTLSNKDSDIFLEMLENPPQPNEALLNAVKEYKSRVKK
jgi:uncharacterized protein (DUF1778 family)